MNANTYIYTQPNFVRVLLAAMFPFASPLSTQANEVGFQQIAAGTAHTVAVKQDGTLWTWGAGSAAQLGDGTRTYKLDPVQVDTATNWHGVAASIGYTLALKIDGTLWAWGRNDSGQLGDGTTRDKSRPVQVGAETNWQAVAAGDYHTMAVKQNGTL